MTSSSSRAAIRRREARRRDQMLQADPVDPRVLDALRPARSMGQSKAASSGNTEARSASETPRPDPIALEDAAAAPGDVR